jgi:hypothetical protein
MTTSQAIHMKKMKYVGNIWQKFLWKLLYKEQLLDKSKSKSNLKRPRRSQNKNKSTIKRKLEIDL